MTPEKYEGVGTVLVAMVVVGMLVLAFGIVGCDEAEFFRWMGGEVGGGLVGGGDDPSTGPGTGMALTETLIYP